MYRTVFWTLWERGGGMIWFLPAILIPACASSSPAFLMIYSESLTIESSVRHSSLFKFLFIVLLHWVFVATRGLSLVKAAGGYCNCVWAAHRVASLVAERWL